MFAREIIFNLKKSYDKLIKKKKLWRQIPLFKYLFIYFEEKMEILTEY